MKAIILTTIAALSLTFCFVEAFGSQDVVLQRVLFFDGDLLCLGVFEGAGLTALCIRDIENG
ncbi:MAG: hypothetical protein IPM37_23020 [Hahellaceae bacterium]|nr:hypothetical protein [Hahellaceae bacterium]